MEIIPAILPKDFAELEEKIELVKGLVTMVQVDICDGKFTSLPTWPHKKHDDNFEAIQREERGMPFWEDVDVEFDLMIKDPENDINNWIVAGASRIVIHAESTKNLAPLVDKLFGVVEIGLALNIDTPIDVIDSVVEKINFVQCMGIARIGFQGEEFDARVIAKIKEIKQKYPNLIVSVDGGVNVETAALLRDAGADRLVVGSALFESDNIVSTFQELARL